MDWSKSSLKLSIASIYSVRIAISSFRIFVCLAQIARELGSGLYLNARVKANGWRIQEITPMTKRDVTLEPYRIGCYDPNPCPDAPDESARLRRCPTVKTCTKDGRLPRSLLRRGLEGAGDGKTLCVVSLGFNVCSLFGFQVPKKVKCPSCFVAEECKHVVDT